MAAQKRNAGAVAALAARQTINDQELVFLVILYISTFCISLLGFTFQSIAFTQLIVYLFSYIHVHVHRKRTCTRRVCKR